uniref:RNase H type-1 domain-containing protein n=1 Tax=Tanacetum cinerariifolium TaxID=118510 RepID=A0A699J5V5_TANCI|nr:hypothetical protein [Tanacetum cinerariifolium]
MEKLVLSLVFAAKRLRRYFQAHPVTVITDQPIKQVIWLIVCRWVRCRAYIDKPRRSRVHQRAEVSFAASNNKAEYEALVAGLRIAMQMGAKNAQVNVDSKLVANQVFGTYVAREGQIPDSRHGLLHKVDRSKGGGNDYRRAVKEIQIEMPIYRTAAVDVVNNDEELRLNLDLLEERRELTAISEAKSKIKDDELLQRQGPRGDSASKNVEHHKSQAMLPLSRKLGPKWEGPYEVTKALGNRAYNLWSTEGTVLPRTWNVTNLKRCYL